MNSIDDVSRAIGHLEESVKIATVQQTKIFDKLDDMNNRLACLPTVVKRVEEHHKHIEDFKALKSKGTGVLIAVTIGAGVLATAAREAWSMFKVKIGG